MMNEIEQNLVVWIAEKADLKAQNVSVNTNIENIGLDSLGTADLLFMIEEHYRVNVMDSMAMSERFELGTIAELAARLENLLH